MRVLAALLVNALFNFLIGLIVANIFQPGKGMNIVKPTPQLMADMKKVGDVMLADWLKKAGPDGQAVVDAYKK